MFSRLLARQLRQPSSVIGPLLLAPLWNRRNHALNDSAAALLSVQADDVVLEVGCGGGYLLGQLLARITRGTVAGIDASASMVAHCRARYLRQRRSGRLDVRCASVGAIPFETNHFDKVVSVNSLFYWPSVEQGVAECGRVTRIGGALVLVFTSRRSLEGHGFARHGLALHDGLEVGRMVEHAGFTAVHVDERHDRHRSYWCVTGRKADSPEHVAPVGAER